MFNLPEQFAATSQLPRLEVFSELTQIALNSIEELTTLNLNATRDCFAYGITIAKAAGTNDTAGMASLQNLLAQPPLEKLAAYSRGIAAIATAAQAEMSRLVQLAPRASSTKKIPATASRPARKAA